jgi:hypothetical protein
MEIMDAIYEGAYTKALSKMMSLLFLIEKNELSLKLGTYAGITKEEMQMVLDGNKKELKIWEFITKTIEVYER